MLFNKKFSKPAYADFIKCTIICSITLPVISFIGAVIANASADPTAMIGTVTLISIILSSVICGAICIRITNGEMKVPLLGALFVTLIMMITGLISNRGGLPVSALMNYICYFGIFAFSSLILRKRNNKHGRRVKRR